MRLVSRILITFSLFGFPCPPLFVRDSHKTANTAVVLGTVNRYQGRHRSGRAGRSHQPPPPMSPEALRPMRPVSTSFPASFPASTRSKSPSRVSRWSTLRTSPFSVAKSYTYDATLEIKTGIEVIEVTAVSTAELQDHRCCRRRRSWRSNSHAPANFCSAIRANCSHSSPGSTPYETTNGGGFGNSGGTVAGARSDQNAFNLDGIDITDNVIRRRR